MNFPIPRELWDRVTSVSMMRAGEIDEDEFDGSRIGIGIFSREVPGLCGQWEEWIIFAELKPAGGRGMNALNLSDRARRYLAAMPAAVAGSGGHDATFKAACALLHGFSLPAADALTLLREWNSTHCTPAWAEHELRHKIESAAQSTPERGRGYLLRDDDRAAPETTERRRKPAPAAALAAVPDARWPRRDMESIRRIALTGPGVAELYEISPMRPGGMDAEAYVDALFPGNPWLCVGDRMDAAETQRREALRGTLAGRQFIVPSAMRGPQGRTQTGKASARALTNTGPRSYLVIECDFSLTKPDGAATAEAPLLRELAAHGGTVADLCAAVLLWLARTAPLAMIVSSGGKSLHGWFPRQGQTEEKLRRFMRYAVMIGADYHTWTPCQFVRMPEGQRDNGRRQSVQYFNPAVLR